MRARVPLGPRQDNEERPTLWELPRAGKIFLETALAVVLPDLNASPQPPSCLAERPGLTAAKDALGLASAYRLPVRTPRRGRDNPGSAPSEGADCDPLLFPAATPQGKLRRRELSPGLPRDRRKYQPLYYSGSSICRRRISASIAQCQSASLANRGSWVQSPAKAWAAQCEKQAR